jgi:hypothetical protein
MCSERDTLLAFQTLSGEWADLARAEAKAVIAATNTKGHSG